ncbi:MAG TPA: flavodoxin domain-containing protein [Spirochaetia bacterium]|nr:flavodoxin domain-containing protein [Spirochaetia bacterium]
MRCIVVYKSIHHHNTERVARSMAEAIGAECLPVEQSDPLAARDFDLIGLGSGIYFSAHHEELLHWVTGLGKLNRKKIFIFSTSGFEELIFHRALKEKLESLGALIIGEFKCGGWHTFGPFSADGGLQQGRPDRLDLQNAADFAREIAERADRGNSA